VAGKARRDRSDLRLQAERHLVALGRGRERLLL
jgi:hypothetical protein